MVLNASKQIGPQAAASAGVPGRSVMLMSVPYRLRSPLLILRRISRESQFARIIAVSAVTSWFEAPRLRPTGYGGLLTMRV
jgi:hypothetical protein